jgi:hypothetical protein
VTATTAEAFRSAQHEELIASGWSCGETPAGVFFAEYADRRVFGDSLEQFAHDPLAMLDISRPNRSA